MPFAMINITIDIQSRKDGGFWIIGAITSILFVFLILEKLTMYWRKTEVRERHKAKIKLSFILHLISTVLAVLLFLIDRGVHWLRAWYVITQAAMAINWIIKKKTKGIGKLCCVLIMWFIAVNGNQKSLVLLIVGFEIANIWLSLLF